ncbi:MAG: putative toxin-antitoxin system toxin component, family [Burkholderiaceae bacterium]|nr:putative toxin-antitoxin system toxin component, family [Burkholderiaceae bacterium]
MKPKRVVLDTNVCLDLFVFHDPRWTALLAALRAGEIEAVTNEHCRNEWLRVLDYQSLPLNDESKLRAATEFDALIACIEPVQKATPLPLCTDSDDQKFLELARDADAALLVTKDKALLKLARKTARAGMFAIIRPETWPAATPLPAIRTVGA